MTSASQGPTASRSARRSISVLGLATLSGQVVTFASLPVVTRIYGPAVYGDYQVVYAGLTMLGAVASLRLERAIPLASSDLQARALAVAAYVIAIVTMGVCAAIVVVSPDGFARLLGNSQVASNVWVVPVGAVLTSSYVIATQWSIRQRKHTQIAIRNGAQPAVTAVAQVLGGLVAAVPAALNAGLLLGRLVGATAAVSQFVGSKRFPRVQLMASSVWRYRGFILVSAPAAMLNAAALQLPVLMVGAHFGSHVAGLYGVSAILTVAPVTVLAGAISQVAMGDVSRRLRNELPGVLGVVRRAAIFAGVVGLVAGFGLVIFSEFASGILGEEWSGVQSYLVALSLVLVSRLPATAISPTLSSFERHKTQLSIDALRVAWILAVFTYGGGAEWSPEVTVLVMAVGVACTYLWGIVLTLVISGRYDRRIGGSSGVRVR